ncbi:MAG: retropepsin-like aspartic protease [Saprospiraceae bacterium]
MNTFIASLLMVTHLNVQMTFQSEPLRFNFQEDYFQTDAQGVIQSDFELVGGLIFLNADLEGESHPFILDTGSPHLLLNSSLSKKNKNGFEISGVGGKKRVKKLYKVNFDWQGINVKRESSYAVNLGNIARIKKRDFAGLISYDQVKRKELLIDYEKEKVFLISKSNKTFFENYDKSDKIWFRMVGHIPVVKVKIGNKRYYFGIDTGAEINVIDKRLRKRLPKDMVASDFLGLIMGGDNKKIEVNHIQVKEMKVGKSYYKNQPFAFADLSFLQGEDGIQLDGLLGYPFLKEALFSINYRKKQLCKWELKARDDEPIQVAISKKRIKITKPFYHGY